MHYISEHSQLKVSSDISLPARSLSSSVLRRHRKKLSYLKHLPSSVSGEKGSCSAVKLMIKSTSASNKQLSSVSKTASALKLRYSSIISTRRASAAASSVTTSMDVTDCMVNVERFQSSCGTAVNDGPANDWEQAKTGDALCQAVDTSVVENGRENKNISQFQSHDVTAGDIGKQEMAAKCEIVTADEQLRAYVTTSGTDQNIPVVGTIAVPSDSETQSRGFECSDTTVAMSVDAAEGSFSSAQLPMRSTLLCCVQDCDMGECDVDAAANEDSEAVSLEQPVCVSECSVAVSVNQSDSSSRADVVVDSAGTDTLQNSISTEHHVSLSATDSSTSLTQASSAANLSTSVTTVSSAPVTLPQLSPSYPVSHVTLLTSQTPDASNSSSIGMYLSAY